MAAACLRTRADSIQRNATVSLASQSYNPSEPLWSYLRGIQRIPTHKTQLVGFSPQQGVVAVIWSFYCQAGWTADNETYMLLRS